MHYVTSLIPGFYLSTQIVIVPMIFGVKMSETIFLLVSICILVIEFVVMSIILIIKKNKIIKSLSYSSLPDGIERTEEIKKKQLQEYEIDENYISSYLRVGIAYACDFFIDFSLPKFMIENYKSLDVLIETTQAISFFTGKHFLLGHCLSLLQQYKKLNNILSILNLPNEENSCVKTIVITTRSFSKINKISKESSDAIRSIRQFWNEISLPHSKIDFHQIVTIQDTSNKYRTIYFDLSDKYPNNIEISKEYCNFLIEGAGDFKEASKWYYKAMMLEQGKHLNVDHSFVSLMNIFPKYLINEIVNIRGEFIENNDKKSKLNNNADASLLSSLLSSSTNGSEIGQKLEEVTTGMIKNSRLRLSLQNALNTFEYPGLKTSKFITILQAIFIVLFLIIFCITILSPTSGIYAIVEEILYFGDTYISSEYSTFISSLLFNTHPLINEFEGLNKVNEYTHYPIINITSNNNSLNNGEIIISKQSKNGIINLLELMNSLLSQSDKRGATFEDLLYQMFSMNLSMNLHIQQLNSEQKSIRGVIFESLNYYLHSTGYWESEQKNTINYLDSLYTGSYNIFHINENLAKIKDGIASDGNDYVNSVYDIYLILLLLISILFFIMFAGLQFYSISSLYRNCNNIIKVLKEVKKDTIKLSLKSISKLDKSKKNRKTKSSTQLLIKHNFSYIFLPYMTIITLITNTVMIVLVFYIARLRIQDIGKLIVWFNIANTRFGSLYETVGLIGYICSLSNENDINELTKFLLPTYETFKDSWTSMLTGNEEVVRFMGVDEDLDEIHFTDTCNDLYTEIYKFYNCLSLDRKIIQADILLKSLIQTIQLKGAKNINLNSEEKYSNLVLLCEFYLYDNLITFQNYFETYGNSQTATFTNETQMFSIIFMFISIILFILQFLLYNSFNKFIDGVKTLIRFLPPESIIENNSLMELIIDNKEEDEDKKYLSPAQTIISSLSYPIILINPDLTIISINKSAENITGMINQQVIGSHLTTFIPYIDNNTNNVSDLYINIERIKQNEINSISIRVNINNALSQIDLIGIHSQMNENINSLALSIHSMKKEEDLRLNAIESKQKTEEIIQKHLPKSIMYGLDQHEKDDSSYYVSDNCTIISIEIIGILDSVFNMTPKQTFEILRKIYLYFDDIIKKYPSLIIMKKNEQNIILCSGLFDFADQPKLQIAQSLNFCNEIINATDDLSEQLMLDITFNIAIVFGGPIAGNILCKSYPTFELVGNLLETVMVFLEDESIGIIKMNKEAMDLMDKREFVIDKEKEIREKNVKMFFVKKVLTK